MNESSYRLIVGFVVVAYGIAMSAIMAFRPERILAFHCRSRAWRWTYKFFYNMSTEDIMSARMIRITRFQGWVGLVFCTVLMWGLLFRK
ncbi:MULTISPECIES: hypothetical protein [unclassified Burkholderia]|uniref:hypothetical protein n=1 Tax=unclassified Burkholderia TaxID=2613784 RepID=UPI000B79E605|nr:MULTISPECIES: hypothetical protein [unclassified Burkholderia]MCA8067661.1 hypothetical protein [Burkholderia sp. AU38729]OXI24863.1 hypothetical protein CFB43_09460 [Burkholderia sp. AU15512]